jgi:hypothetical protein
MARDARLACEARAHGGQGGYCLAVTQTEMSFRPSDRAARLGVIVHDVSYVGTAELRGR